MRRLPGRHPADPATVLEVLGGRYRRLLLAGPMGSGKSTLAAAIARCASGGAVGITADPGSPAFGPPGTVALARWQEPEGWRSTRMLPLCSLDAARFRLPLVQAVARLAREVRDEWLIVDAPGVVRGVAGAEMLHGLVQAAGVDAVLVLDSGEASDLDDDLAALPCAQLRLAADPAASRPPRSQRERRRTGAWDAYLAQARNYRLDLEELAVTGTPPPDTVPEAWRGRQAALLRRGEPAMMGEVVDLAEGLLTLRLPEEPGEADGLMIRDAWRNTAGMLVTAPRTEAPPSARDARHRPAAPRAGQDPVSVSVNGVTLDLPNGVLGDPLVAVRLANIPHRVLLDLGEAARMSVKALHAVRHVFVSHAHLDHIGGFVHLLRARLSGEPPPCRLYGPPGMAGHVAGFVSGIRWDRIGDTGPVFLVAEVHDSHVSWWRIQPGHEPRALEAAALADGELWREENFRVRSVTLDHGGIPVLAFRLELADTLHVREDALVERGLRPGPWLGMLKRHLARGEVTREVTLPDGRRERAGPLGEALVRLSPGTRIAYATDLADSPRNRQTLGRLAHDADLLVCECTFLEEDAGQAHATGHLTVTACVEIAAAAGVARLLPFHFSRRYSVRLPEVYDALQTACRGTPLEGKLVGAG